ncbi:hypothetical protein V2J09_012892 [Rumex salicifolius]
MTQRRKEKIHGSSFDIVKGSYLGETFHGKSWDKEEVKMYVTRPLSLYRHSPQLLSSSPLEGPNSGILVIQDEESTPNCCFGLSKACCTIVDLPFPQNKLLNVHYQAGQVALCDDVYLIPILNQPLSSNRYYAIKPHGSHKGEALTCSKEEDMATCLFCFSCVKDAKPRPLDPDDVYQQFEIFRYQNCLPHTTFMCCGRFSTRSVASDGYPPRFLRRCGWSMFSKEPKSFSLGEASGLDTNLRARLPDFSFLASQDTSSPPVVVGKWYCPFMFVREGELKDQMKRSMYYEMKLDQRWERIFTCEYSLGKKYVDIDVIVPTQVVRIEGKKEVEKDERDGFAWFSSVESTRVGLSSLIVERMLWEEERVGFVKKEKQERVFRREEYAGEGGWRRFGCYVLVERFVLLRLDGSLVLTYDFKHTHQIKTKHCFEIERGIKQTTTMYVTRPLSLYQNNPSTVALPPPEGPNGGYLVLQDDASTARMFFGLFKDSNIKDFPFPQNKLHVVGHGSGEHRTHYPVYFIPAINYPLSSNIYYAIKTKRKHKGKACTSSSDEEMTTCCLGSCINDVDPIPLDPTNTYQQFNVSKKKSWHHPGFMATSLARDGNPPWFLRSKGWDLASKTPKNFSLGEANGMDHVLRARLPDFNFSVSYEASNPVVVGKWYSPFMFIKDNLTPKEQVKNSMYYEMTLEQKWDRIFYCDNNSGSKNKVFVDVAVPNESATVAGADAIQQINNREDKVVWFSTMDGRARAGLSSLIVERMKWEEQRVGWVPNQGNVLKIEELGKSWERYGCYILVERFVVRRMDGSVFLTYSFNHKHQIRSKTSQEFYVL